MTICILGRQPEIGLAELQSRYGTVVRVNQTTALVDAETDLSVLGSTVKTATLLTTLDTLDVQKAFRALEKALPKLVHDLPPGKIKLGLSLYGLTMTPFVINGHALRLKKQLVRLGRSARTVPNTHAALSSAQTYHNGLAKELGLEFVLTASDNKISIGRVTAVQNIDEYRIRDRERPKRDAFVGMLPPKLAQTMISLAGAEKKVWDPFCGTGVVLMEAALQGMDACGSDVSKKMVEYSRANLDWLMQREAARGTTHTHPVEIHEGDATTISAPTLPFTIVTETYLGQPLGGQTPSEEKIYDILHDVNATLRAFLKNIAPQLASGSRHCIAVPAWFVHGKVYHLPLVDELEKIGFSRVVFEACDGLDLIYRREDQTTGRELLVVRKI